MKETAQSLMDELYPLLNNDQYKLINFKCTLGDRPDLTVDEILKELIKVLKEGRYNIKTSVDNHLPTQTIEKFL